MDSETAEISQSQKLSPNPTTPFARLLHSVLVEDGLSIPALARRIYGLNLPNLPGNLENRLRDWRRNKGKPKASESRVFFGVQVAMRAHRDPVAGLGDLSLGAADARFRAWVEAHPPMPERCIAWDAIYQGAGFQAAVRPLRFTATRTEYATGFTETVRALPARPLEAVQFLDVLQRVRSIELTQSLLPREAPRVAISEALVAHAEEAGLVDELVALVVAELERNGDPDLTERLLAFGCSLVARVPAIDADEVAAAVATLEAAEGASLLTALLRVGRFAPIGVGAETHAVVVRDLLPVLAKRLSAPAPAGWLAAYQLGAFTWSGSVLELGARLDASSCAAVQDAAVSRAGQPKEVGLLLRILGKQRLLQRIVGPDGGPGRPVDWIYGWAAKADGGRFAHPPGTWVMLEEAPEVLAGALGQVVRETLAGAADARLRLSAIRYCLRNGWWSDTFLEPLGAALRNAESLYMLDEVSIALAHAPGRVGEPVLLEVFAEGSAKVADREYLALVGHGGRSALRDLFNAALEREGNYAPGVAYALCDLHFHGWMTLLFQTGWMRCKPGRQAVFAALKRFWRS